MTAARVAVRGLHPSVGDLAGPCGTGGPGGGAGECQPCAVVGDCGVAANLSAGGCSTGEDAPVTKSVVVRDAGVPETLVVLRMGSNTLSDNALAQACERAYAAMGLHAFSVFEIRTTIMPSSRDSSRSWSRARRCSRPRVPSLWPPGSRCCRRGGSPIGLWFSRSRQRISFARVRSHFHGPIDNPIWTGRS